MGKATGIGSQFRGKVGNVIGYISKNRAGRYEQTVKGYQPVVANPQTYAQALARVPVGPVQRVCSALLTIVQRGFEGIAYVYQNALRIGRIGSIKNKALELVMILAILQTNGYECQLLTWYQ